MKLYSIVPILLALVLALSPGSAAQTSPSDPTTTPSLGGILVYDRDMLHNAAPFDTTNETTITVDLVSPGGVFQNVHLAEDDLFTSNVQSFYGPPLGTYDGSTTFSFILTPGDGPKTVWAILEGEAGSVFRRPVER